MPAEVTVQSKETVGRAGKNRLAEEYITPSYKDSNEDYDTDADRGERRTLTIARLDQIFDRDSEVRRDKAKRIRGGSVSDVRNKYAGFKPRPLPRKANTDPNKLRRNGIIWFGAWSI